MTIQFKLSPRWLFMNAFDLGEIKFGGPLSPDRDMLHSLLDLHRKRDAAPVVSPARF